MGNTFKTAFLLTRVDPVADGNRQLLRRAARNAHRPDHCGRNEFRLRTFSPTRLPWLRIVRRP